MVRHKIPVGLLVPLAFLIGVCILIVTHLLKRSVFENDPFIFDTSSRLSPPAASTIQQISSELYKKTGIRFVLLMQGEEHWDRATLDKRILEPADEPFLQKYMGPGLPIAVMQVFEDQGKPREQVFYNPSLDYNWRINLRRTDNGSSAEEIITNRFREVASRLEVGKAGSGFLARFSNSVLVTPLLFLIVLYWSVTAYFGVFGASNSGAITTVITRAMRDTLLAATSILGFIWLFDVPGCLRFGFVAIGFISATGACTLFFSKPNLNWLISCSPMAICGLFLFGISFVFLRHTVANSSELEVCALICRTAITGAFMATSVYLLLLMATLTNLVAPEAWEKISLEIAEWMSIWLPEAKRPFTGQELLRALLVWVITATLSFFRICNILIGGPNTSISVSGKGARYILAKYGFASNVKTRSVANED